MKLSIVTTLYKSSLFIDEFYSRVINTLKNITENYEIVFVDDGSPDDSLKKVLKLVEEDKKVKVVELSRNFGHHKALMAGLSQSKGDYVFLIDSDLEEAPELLELFWDEIHKSDDIDVIYGKQKQRKGDFFEKLSGKIFYSVLDKLIDDIKYPTDTLTSRLMTRRYVNDVIKSSESEYDLWSIFEYTGYKTKGVLCDKGYKKSTTYTLGKKLDMATHIIVSTSKKPLQFIFYMGIIISLFSFTYLGYSLINKLFFDVPIGWTSLIILLTFILGIVIFSIGVVGIYISVIFLETKNRKVIIKKIYKKGKSD